MNRRPLWLAAALLGPVVAVLLLLRGVARVTVVIVAGEPFDVIDVDDEDDLDDEVHEVSYSHGYVPAV